MERKKDSFSNQSSSYGTTGGTESTTPPSTTDADILNTDEDTLTGTPLRSDLEIGMDSDMSAGVAAGPNFMGNTDSDSDAGLSYATTTVSDTYAIPGAINDDKKPLDVAKDSFADAKTTLSSATESAKSQVSELAEQAKVKVGELTSQATDKVKEQLGGQKDKATEGLTAITDAIRQSASTLEEKGQAPIAGAVTGFAGQIENFAGYLQGKSVDELAEDVTSYAKQNPQLFVGGAFLLGIALARFLKSSNRSSTGYYNTSTVTSGSNSFGSTPVIPAYTGTTTYKTGKTTYDTGTSFGTDSTDYAVTTTRGYDSTEGTVI
ncbi:MAG: hypothetical protein H8F28_27190 [Fibrella sp.]|nr:hypothetical protein [Armatimonadota bacterium]